MNRPKQFWEYTKSLRKTNAYPLTVTNGTTNSTDFQEATEMFANHFSSSHENMSLCPLIRSPINVSQLYSVTIDETQIHSILCKLDINKGSGCDDIPNIFLKNCADTLCTPLKLLYQLSVEQGIFPDLWKETRVLPVYKKGDLNFIGNYRPIAILNALEKVFEKLMHTKIFEHVVSRLTPTQHGFVAGKSTISNLLEHFQNLASTYEQGQQSDTAYLDMTQAFDKVNHVRLTEYLEYMGINGNLLDWFKSYLSNRKVVVVFNGHSSTPYIPCSGVPQGSILGPLLFAIYVNNLPDVVKSSSVLLYADDIKVNKTINSTDDSTFLETDINAVVSWCKQNGLNVNISKCATITYSTSTNPLNYTYRIDNEPLSKCETFKDLGVTFDYNCKFNHHINEITSKAFRMLGFLIRTSKWFRNLSTIIYLYKTLVRSQVEYAAVIWSPHYNIYIEKLEVVQRHFTRYIFRKFHIPYLSYVDRLKVLKLEPLSYRRDVATLVTLYKIVNGLMKTTCIGDICVRRRRNIRNMAVFGIRILRSNVAYYAPIPRALRIYNSIFGNQYIFDLNLTQFVNRVKSGLQLLDT